MARGFHFDRRRKYRRALETLLRALHNAYKGRKRLKREMKSVWIQRINASSRIFDLSYSRFMANLKNKGCLLNRKMLSELAATDFDRFKAVVEATAAH